MQVFTAEEHLHLLSNSVLAFSPLTTSAAHKYVNKLVRKPLITSRDILTTSRTCICYLTFFDLIEFVKSPNKMRNLRLDVLLEYLKCTETQMNAIPKHA